MDLFKSPKQPKIAINSIATLSPYLLLCLSHSRFHFLTFNFYHRSVSPCSRTPKRKTPNHVARIPLRFYYKTITWLCSCGHISITVNVEPPLMHLQTSASRWSNSPSTPLQIAAFIDPGISQCPQRQNEVPMSMSCHESSNTLISKVS